MKRFFLFCLLGLCAPFVSLAQPTPHTLIEKALAAMGGATTVEALESLRLEGFGHEFVLQALMRPGGPQPVQYERFTELRDVAQQRLRRTETEWLAVEPKGRTLQTIYNDNVAAFAFMGRMIPGQVDIRDTARERLLLAPERALFTARAAPDLMLRPDTILFDVPHHAVQFTLHGQRVRLYFDAHTALLAVVETFGARPADFSWNLWGDVKTETRYYGWAREANGLHYPRQWDILRNGRPYQSQMLTRLVQNEATPADSFAIAPELVAAFQQTAAQPRQYSRPNSTPEQILPDIFVLPTQFFKVILVRQTDGIVVLEAPVSSGFGAYVLAEVEKMFPGEPIKAVVVAAGVSTQQGGFRPYVARGIPVYTADLNRAFLTHIATAPFTQAPDALARQPRPIDLRTVSGKVVLGSGTNRLELYPIRGENSDRTLMVYFPAHEMLYASSALTPQRFSPVAWRQRTHEVKTAVARAGLAPKQVFTLYAPPTSWAELMTTFEAEE